MVHQLSLFSHFLKMAAQPSRTALPAIASPDSGWKGKGLRLFSGTG